jgi:hypothetical protein
LPGAFGDDLRQNAVPAHDQARMNILLYSYPGGSAETWAAPHMESNARITDGNLIAPNLQLSRSTSDLFLLFGPTILVLQTFFTAAAISRHACPLGLPGRNSL